MENNQSKQQLNIKNEYELNRQKKIDEQKRLQLKKTIKRISKIALAVLLIGGGIGALGWYIAKQPQTPTSEIISRSGVHWHPELSIYFKGVKQEIPANIGIGITHQSIHTHDTSGVIHLEFQGMVRKQDITLGQFFKNWGKDIGSFGTNIKMIVNGQENTEFENYPMQDKDKIEIRYE